MISEYRYDMPTPKNILKKNSSIYIAGHTGLIGSSLMRLLTRHGYTQLIHASSQNVDLTDQQAVNRFFARHTPEYVIMAAGQVGGILANIKTPADLAWINMQIQNNVIHAAFSYRAKKVLYISCACVYPRDCPQPMEESYLLTGPLEPTNEAYAVAKIAGMTLCKSYHLQYGVSFISCIVANTYGWHTETDLQHSHFLPAMVQNIHDAKMHGKKEVLVWGSGTPRRELLHVDDVSRALLLLLQTYNSADFINIGSGRDYSIREVAQQVKDVIGYNGKLVFDPSKPDGMPRKLLHAEKIRALGWKPEISLPEGIREYYTALLSICENQT